MFEVRPLPRTLAAALRDAEHTRPAIRRSSARDLARLAADDVASAGDAAARDVDQARSALKRLLLQDNDLEVRAQTALALADAGVGGCEAELVKACGDPEPRVRQMALLALGELGHAEQAGLERALSLACGDEGPALRFQALLAAGRLRVPRLELLLAQALLDTDGKVRYLALRLLDEHYERWSDVPGRLQQACCKAQNDEDTTVRVAAALFLGRVSTLRPVDAEGLPAAVVQRAVQELLQALERGQALPAPEDDQALIELVAELGLQAAVPALQRAAWGRWGLLPGRFAWQARVSLVRLGDARAQRYLQRALQHRRRDVRALAVAAVGMARYVELKPELERLAQTDKVDPDTVAEALARLAEVGVPGGPAP